MAEEGGEAPSKAVALAYNVGVVLQVLDKTSKTVTRMAYALERVKSLFKKTEKQSQQSSQAVNSAFAGMAGGGGMAALLQGLQGGGGGMGIMGLAGSFNTLVGAIQNVGATLGANNPIMQMHSQSEDLNNTMAGTLQALGFVPDMNAGLALTSRVMSQINRAAAPLPGEASEYISVFRAGLPHLASGLDNNMDRMVEFSNRFAAIGRTFGVDADQIGRDMALMMRAGTGGAGADVATWQQFLPFVNAARRARNETELTAESFNRLSQKKRFEVMQNAFGGLNDMVGRAAQSWSAISGSINATASTIASGITRPFFDFAKQGLSAFNDRLNQAQDKIIEIGRSISEGIVGGIRVAMGYFERMVNTIRNAPIFAQIQERMTAWGQRFGQSFQGDSEEAHNMRTGGVALIGRMLLGPVGILAGAFMELGSRTEFIERFVNSLAVLFGWVLTMLRPIIAIFGVLNRAIADVAQGALVGLVDGISFVAQGISEFLNGIYPVINSIYETIKPGLAALGEAIGGLFRNLGMFLLPLLRGLAVAAIWLWDRFRGPITTVVNGLITALTMLINFISDILARLGRRMEAAAGRGMVNNPLLGTIDQLMSSLNGPSTAAGESPTTAAGRRRGAPTARGGSNVHNDFRNSRFDINQKFADGFDPDRIAVAFASDLEAMADRRLQSGFDPLFSVHR